MYSEEYDNTADKITWSRDIPADIMDKIHRGKTVPVDGVTVWIDPLDATQEYTGERATETLCTEASRIWISNCSDPLSLSWCDVENIFKNSWINQQQFAILPLITRPALISQKNFMTGLMYSYQTPLNVLGEPWALGPVWVSSTYLFIYFLYFLFILNFPDFSFYILFPHRESAQVCHNNGVCSCTWKACNWGDTSTFHWFHW